MASVRKEALIDAPADEVWSRLRDVGNVAQLFPGVLTDSRLDDERSRTVTFSNGMVVKEHLVALDDESRRLVYTTKGERLTHHNASMQIVPETDHVCRFIWISDILPDEALQSIGQLIDAGTRSFQSYWAR